MRRSDQLKYVRDVLKGPSVQQPHKKESKDVSRQRDGELRVGKKFRSKIATGDRGGRSVSKGGANVFQWGATWGRGGSNV